MSYNSQTKELIDTTLEIYIDLNQFCVVTLVN
jgi:hypothetical protein